eukprot:m.326813 g.326813  ORF g.326813 m.326813 type:complete len:138 (+) comp16487_c0_seq2:645-1058(+)
MRWATSTEKQLQFSKLETAMTCGGLEGDRRSPRRSLHFSSLLAQGQSPQPFAPRNSVPLMIASSWESRGVVVVVVVPPPSSSTTAAAAVTSVMIRDCFSRDNGDNKNKRGDCDNGHPNEHFVAQRAAGVDLDCEKVA